MKPRLMQFRKKQGDDTLCTTTRSIKFVTQIYPLEKIEIDEKDNRIYKGEKSYIIS